MEGFSKLELSNQNTNSQPEQTQKPPRFQRLRNRRVYVGVVVFVVILLFLIIVPTILTLFSARKTYAQVNTTLAALKKQDVTVAGKELKKTRESLKDTQTKMNLMFVLRFIPIANIYYNDATHLVKAGFYGLDAGEIFIGSIEPYADVLGLKGQGSFVGGSAQQRIETAVKTMDKVTPRIDEISEKLDLAKEEIDNVDPKSYPSFIAGGKVKDRITQLRKFSDDGVALIHDAKPLIKVLPSLLGEPKTKRYLIIFQNDKEIRPTGGFMTAYSVFRLEHGVVHVDISEDIYTLDATVPGKPDAPRPIKTYLPLIDTFHLRDTNLSPDFPTSMKTFREMYEKAGGYREVDGIIALDTHVLVSAMNILGDIQVGGKTYTTKEDPRCKCPQVIYELESYADTPVNFIRGDRKSIIGDLMYEIMNKAFSSSPKIYWGPLFQAMVTDMSEKHVLFNLYDKEAQEGIFALNAGGKIKDVQGDYLHINQANFGGAKSNLYVTESVLQEYNPTDQGVINKKLIVTYKNPEPPSDCNLERGGLCLNATLRNWFRIYVPKGSKLVKSHGSEVKMITYDELEKTVFEGFLTVRPQGISTLTIEYSLPFKLAKGSPLPLLIQKQPGTDGHDYTVLVKGKQIDKFPLKTDKNLSLDL